MTSIVKDDLRYIYDNLSKNDKEKLKNSKILLTGCGGFLGYYFMNFLVEFMDELEIKKIVGYDNFKLGLPTWIEQIKKNQNVKIDRFDVVTDEFVGKKDIEDCDYIIHMASIASPVFYRKYPIETLDANVNGLRKLLDFYKIKQTKGILFYSSSEIYGDPVSEEIPTKEEYNGNVSAIGPRACYDEAKRFGETLCYLYANTYDMPIMVARPFNNYGPGMKLNDKRVPADFANAIYENKDIQMYSDGTPTRTFCYISDAILGYLKVLFHGKYDYFNIGIDNPEISVKKLALIYQKLGKDILGYDGSVNFKIHDDEEYLSNNPNRRCPDISKARKILNYNPKILVEEGVERFLKHIKESKKEELIW